MDHDLEWAVRIVASQDAGHEHNKFYGWEGCLVSATSSAGVCGSSVVRGEITLYRANGNGSNVSVLREGRWIGRLIAEAERIQRERDEYDEIERRRVATEAATNFAPIDF